MANPYGLFSAVLALLLLSGWTAGAQQKEKVSATPPTAAPKKTATTAKSPAKTSAKAPAKKPARVPIGQRSPTRDRYREIQQSLMDAGYFDGPVDGLWGKSSIEALRNFQSAQGLEPTGKINALTLIRLNLGPQYEQPNSDESAAGGTPSG